MHPELNTFQIWTFVESYLHFFLLNLLNINEQYMHLSLCLILGV